MAGGALGVREQVPGAGEQLARDRCGGDLLTPAAGDRRVAGGVAGVPPGGLRCHAQGPPQPRRALLICAPRRASTSVTGRGDAPAGQACPWPRHDEAAGPGKWQSCDGPPFKGWLVRLAPRLERPGLSRCTTAACRRRHDGDRVPPGPRCGCSILDGCPGHARTAPAGSRASGASRRSSVERALPRGYRVCGRGQAAGCKASSPRSRSVW
jgi:hypothetical protein